MRGASWLVRVTASHRNSCVSAATGSSVATIGTTTGTVAAVTPAVDDTNDTRRSSGVAVNTPWSAFTWSAVASPGDSGGSAAGPVPGGDDTGDDGGDSDSDPSGARSGDGVLKKE